MGGEEDGELAAEEGGVDTCRATSQSSEEREVRVGRGTSGFIIAWR